MSQLLPIVALNNKGVEKMFINYEMHSGLTAACTATRMADSVFNRFREFAFLRRA